MGKKTIYRKFESNEIQARAWFESKQGELRHTAFAQFPSDAPIGAIASNFNDWVQSAEDAGA